jgi:hypothetical protein
MCSEYSFNQEIKATHIVCNIVYSKYSSPDNSVGIATGYEMEGLGSIPGSATFYLLHSVQTDTGVPHPAFYPRDTGESFPGDKATGE